LEPPEPELTEYARARQTMSSRVVVGLFYLALASGIAWVWSGPNGIVPLTLGRVWLGLGQVAVLVLLVWVCAVISQLVTRYWRMAVAVGPDGWRPPRWLPRARLLRYLLGAGLTGLALYVGGCLILIGLTILGVIPISH
jgi:hypothetical protein